MERKESNTTKVIRFLAVTVVVMANVSILGFVFDLPWAYRQLSPEGMAFNTAICFLMTGICLYLLTRRGDGT